MENFFRPEEIEALVRRQDIVSRRISGDWRDGLLLGNGSIGAIGCVNGCLEWVVNRNDVFDGRVPEGRQLTHRELMAYLDAHAEKESYFMRDLEAFGTHLLYPFFPSGRYIAPSDRAETAATLRYIEEHAVERAFMGKNCRWFFLHGWSWLLYHMTKLRLGEEQRAWDELQEFLDFFAKPNGLFSHNAIVIADPADTEPDGPTPQSFSASAFATPDPESKRLVAPVIEGNSIFLMYAAETLIRSFDGVIRLFPDVPPDATVRFERLMAEGGFETSAEMKEGMVTRVRIFSRAGGALRIENPWDHSIQTFDTEIGQVIELKYTR